MKRDNQVKPVRCAIYTRKSSDENLDDDFNSLDSQREYCEAFIKSQGALGWVFQPERYDDAGYSGGSLNRPAFKRLMADIQAHRIDCIVVYKYERLSRSLYDFLSLMKTLEELGVTFVSVTQQFNTSTSAGRMSLNIMLSLAQYERENASERTRDKIAAARRKGKWSGGRPILGYDVNRETKELVVNEVEAEQVRTIFKLYLEHEKLLAVVKELTQRGWRNKQWTTGKGELWGGRAFDKCSLFNLLTNVAYMGLVRHKDQSYPGEHKAIIDATTFSRVQKILKRNGRTGGALVRNRYNALLKGLVFCDCCKCSMGHSYSSKNGRTQYRYYLCHTASKKGWNACPGPSVPAGELEAFVVERIRGVARDPKLIAATVKKVQAELRGYVDVLENEKRALEQDRKRLHADLRKAAASGGSAMTTRISDINDRVVKIESRLETVSRELETARCSLISQQEVVSAFGRFDELWNTLAPHEQIKVIRLLVKRVEWNGRDERIRIVFQPTGLRGLVDRTNEIKQEVAA
jgi:site-specific DNA recombinase